MLYMKTIKLNSSLVSGLSGIFDTSLHVAGGNTTETSVMNFLSAIESRTAQASSGTTLLPQFRAPSWQTGNSNLFIYL